MLGGLGGVRLQVDGQAVQPRGPQAGVRTGFME